MQGTTGVLRSALLHAPSVKRIVVTSSCAAILEPTTVPRLFSEEDWNQESVVAVKEKGRDADGGAKYRASKTLAERAAWDFYEKHKSEVGWELVVLNPPYVFGPILHEVSSPESLNESTRLWYDTVVKGKMDNDALANDGCVLE